MKSSRPGQSAAQRTNEGTRSMAQVQAYSVKNPFTLINNIQQIPTNQPSSSYNHQLQQTQRQNKK